MKAVVHYRKTSDDNNRNVVVVVTCSSVIPFVFITMCVLGFMGKEVQAQRSSVQLLEGLDVFLGLGVLHSQIYAQGRASVLRRRHLQQNNNKECTQIQLDWLSNALVGQCNVTNPRQLVSLPDADRQNCCSYATIMIQERCFQPCLDSEVQALMDSFGLASFWVAYCEVEYTCVEETRKLPGNSSQVALRAAASRGVEEEVGVGMEQDTALEAMVKDDEQEEKEEEEQGDSELGAVLTPAAQSQLHALATVHIGQIITEDVNSYEETVQSSPSESIQTEKDRVSEEFPRLSKEALEKFLPNPKLPKQITNRSIVQNLNLMPDLEFIANSINSLPSIQQHLAQVDGKTYTLFAPTNQAFQDLADTLGVQVSKLSSLSSWLSIIKNLIVPGEHSLLEIFPGDSLQTLVPEAALVCEHSILRQSVILKGCCDPLNSAHLLLGDIRMANGILHVIDKVILPPNAPFRPQDVVYLGG